jgi:proteasome assembly chaperone (PAC2) family protein
VIELEGVPELVDPVMVAAFEGWNDAGDAASTAVAHLDREWKGEVFAALDAEDYYDFQVNRPTVFLEDGVRKITWPTTRLSVVRVGGDKPRDLVLVRGIEPSMRWRSFCNELLGFAHELGVELVVVLGALLGDTPHTRPVPISGTTSDADLARRMDLEETKYEGPTGIVGASGNSVLCSLLDGLSGPTTRARVWRGLTQEDAVGRTLHEHRAILAALRDRDAEAARSWATVHIASVEQWLRASL